MNETIASILKAKGPKIHAIVPNATVHEALTIMAEKGIAAVLVLADGRLAGIVSAKDFARKVVLPGRSARDTRVQEIMTSPVVTVKPEATVPECIAIMTRRNFRHLPVFSEGELVGVVTLADLARAVISDQAFKIDQLMTYVGHK